MPICSRLLLIAILLTNAFLANGCANKSSSGNANVDGLGKFRYGISNGRATLSVVFTKLKIDAGATIPLSRPQGAYVQLSPDFETDGTLLSISVPIASLLHDNKGDLPVVGLPDGRPLPGVKSGGLGVLAVNLPVVGITYLYMGSDVYGIFFPMKIPNIPVITTLKIRDELGNLLGVLSIIPKGTKGSVSGALFLFPVEGSSSAIWMNKIL